MLSLHKRRLPDKTNNFKVEFEWFCLARVRGCGWDATTEALYSHHLSLSYLNFHDIHEYFVTRQNHQRFIIYGQKWWLSVPCKLCLSGRKTSCHARFIWKHAMVTLHAAICSRHSRPTWRLNSFITLFIWQERERESDIMLRKEEFIKKSEGCSLDVKSKEGNFCTPNLFSSPNDFFPKNGLSLSGPAIV